MKGGTLLRPLSMIGTGLREYRNNTPRYRETVEFFGIFILKDRSRWD